MVSAASFGYLSVLVGRYLNWKAKKTRRRFQTRWVFLEAGGSELIRGALDLSAFPGLRLPAGFTREGPTVLQYCVSVHADNTDWRYIVTAAAGNSSILEADQAAVWTEGCSAPPKGRRFCVFRSRFLCSWKALLSEFKISKSLDSSYGQQQLTGVISWDSGIPALLHFAFYFPHHLLCCLVLLYLLSVLFFVCFILSCTNFSNPGVLI